MVNNATREGRSCREEREEIMEPSVRVWHSGCCPHPALLLISAAHHPGAALPSPYLSYCYTCRPPPLPHLATCSPSRLPVEASTPVLLVLWIEPLRIILHYITSTMRRGAKTCWHGPAPCEVITRNFMLDYVLVQGVRMRGHGNKENGKRTARPK